MHPNLPAVQRLVGPSPVLETSIKTERRISWSVPRIPQLVKTACRAEHTRLVVETARYSTCSMTRSPVQEKSLVGGWRQLVT